MDLKTPSTYELAILNGLQHKRAGEVYQGTVPGHVTARRRKRNKAARVSRRINRAGAR
jgi:hypothetical protein